VVRAGPRKDMAAVVVMERRVKGAKSARLCALSCPLRLQRQKQTAKFGSGGWWRGAPPPHQLAALDGRYPSHCGYPPCWKLQNTDAAYNARWRAYAEKQAGRLFF